LLDCREAGTKQAVVGTWQEDRRSDPEVGDAIPVRARDALDEPVKAEAAQVVRHLTPGELAGREPEQWTDMLS
jgi:hypothetical protein